MPTQIENARHFLAYAASLIGRPYDWAEPVPVPRAGLYWPGQDRPDLAALSRNWAPDRPVAAIVFYRWEVIVRETVVVGVVGAGGLGQLINEHLAARDFAAVIGAVGAMVVIALVIDAASAGLRPHLR